MVHKSKMLSMLAAAKSEENIKAISLRFLPAILDHNSQAPGSETDSNILDINEEIFGNSGALSLFTKNNKGQQ